LPSKQRTGLTKIILKKGKDEAVRRFHPWVFSGAVKQITGEPEDGDWVNVFDSREQYLGSGHYHDGSITVRLLTFEEESQDTQFWEKRLTSALRARRTANLIDNRETNCYRLVHGEGDGLSGLIIDVYGSTAVVQCHSIGMHRERRAISDALLKVYDQKLTAIYDKSESTLPQQYAEDVIDDYLFGEEGEAIVRENGNWFKVDWEAGQKTGFFLDQRDNRQLVKTFPKVKRFECIWLHGRLLGLCLVRWRKIGPYG
jgi:23S rRNA (cytosine1962-C5)-methyltransferase